jgi:hypothetical protein
MAGTVQEKPSVLSQCEETLFGARGTSNEAGSRLYSPPRSCAAPRMRQNGVKMGQNGSKSTTNGHARTTQGLFQGVHGVSTIPGNAKGNMEPQGVGRMSLLPRKTDWQAPKTGHFKKNGPLQHVVDVFEAFKSPFGPTVRV